MFTNRTKFIILIVGFYCHVSAHACQKRGGLLLRWAHPSWRFSVYKPAMSSEAAPNGSAPETATDASPTAGAAQAGGGASFLQKRVLVIKTSGQNIAEDITGSRRGASQLATAASPALGASQARSRASVGT